MVQPAKLEWPACFLCGDPNGKIARRGCVTPSRFGLDTPELRAVMNEGDLALLNASSHGTACYKCRNVMHSRLYRERRRNA